VIVARRGEVSVALGRGECCAPGRRWMWRAGCRISTEAEGEEWGSKHVRRAQIEA
jgi:hypothetical protein